MKIIVIILVCVNILNAVCFYVPSIPNGMSGMNTITSNLSNTDSGIGNEFDSLKNKLSEKKDLLEKLNEKYKEYVNLNKEKQIYLKKIQSASSDIVDIIKEQ